VGRTVSVCLNI